MADDRQNVGEDQTSDRLVRSTFIAPLPPKSFRVEKAQNGIRFFAGDRSRLTPGDGRLSGSVEYRVRWAETLDNTSSSGLAAALTRSTAIAPSIPASGKEGVESSAYVTDPKYASGWFFCVGVDASGQESTEYAGPVQLSGEILDSSVPPDWNHFDVSESGEEITPGIIDSVLTVTAYAPNPLGSLDGLQLYLKDYTRLGVTEESEYRRYNGAPGGSLTFKAPLALVRRAGTGTINVTNGSTAVTVTSGALLSEAQDGDQLELLGLRITIDTVTNNTTMTLLTAWTGATGAFDGWKVVPLVTVYGVAVSKGGTRRSDIENAPSKQVLLDGDISAPVAPVILAATAMGNVVRIDVQQPIGTALDRLHLFRGASGAAFSACVELDSQSINAALATTSSGQLQFEDSKFTVYERENNVAFTYYCTVTNLRGESSPPSIAVTAQCRLDTGSDNGPPTTAREVPLNYLWNGMLSGTAGAVSTADTGQDANMGGGVPPTGWNRWDQFISGAGSTPSFINSTEVILAMTGAAGVAGVSGISQNVGAWSNGTAGKRRIPPGKILVFQFKARTTGGSPNGFLYFDIRQLNGAGVVQGSGGYRQRRSNDLVDFTDTTAIVNCSNMTTDAQIYWGVFQLDTTLTTAEIQVRLYYLTSSWNGVNMYVSEVMLSIGETLPPWTGQMVDKNITYGAPSGGAPFTYSRYPDGYAANRNYIPVYP